MLAAKSLDLLVIAQFARRGTAKEVVQSAPLVEAVQFRNVLHRKFMRRRFSNGRLRQLQFRSVEGRLLLDDARITNWCMDESPSEATQPYMDGCKKEVATR
jgi:hypothetical protein